MTGLGDLRAELTVLTRYVLAELDNEKPLLRIMATESRTRPHLLDGVIEHLVRSSYSGFGQWLQRETDLPTARADAITAVGVGALLSSRLIPALFGVTVTDVDDDDDDETFVQTWATMMHNAIERNE